VAILSHVFWETEHWTLRLGSLNWDKLWSGTDIWLSTSSRSVKSTQRFGSGLRFRHQVIYEYIQSWNILCWVLMLSISSVH
jgi:hypothetical protein